MDSLDWSAASLGVNEEQIKRLNPRDAAEYIRHAIDRLTDGEIWSQCVRLGLNFVGWDSTDGIVFRDRLERYVIRKYFGQDATPWDPKIDEYVRENNVYKVKPHSAPAILQFSFAQSSQQQMPSVATPGSSNSGAWQPVTKQSTSICTESSSRPVYSQCSMSPPNARAFRELPGKLSRLTSASGVSAARFCSMCGHADTEVRVSPEPQRTQPVSYIFANSPTQTALPTQYSSVDLYSPLPPSLEGVDAGESLPYLASVAKASSPVQESLQLMLRKKPI